MLRRLYLKFLAKRNPTKYASKIGVDIGKNNRFVSCKYGMFSTEPYLITIGSDCLFSSEVRFLTHDGSLHVFRKEIPKAFIYKRIVIGSNVFVGFRAIIFPGVEIGDNVIIGAGAVVTKSIPSNSVAVGVPAKVISTIEDYKEKILPQIDLVDGLDSTKRKQYLVEKFKLDCNKLS